MICTVPFTLILHCVTNVLTVYEMTATTALVPIANSSRPTKS